MTTTMIETKTITIRKDGGWNHADGRFLMVGDTESIALVCAVKGVGPKGDEAADHMDDMLVAIFAVMHERAQGNRDYRAEQSAERRAFGNC